MTKVAGTNDQVHLMLTSLRLTLLTCSLLTLGVARAGADTINVAEFRWSCADQLDVECLVSDPTDQSIFSLTGLWDYRRAPRTVTDGCYHVRRHDRRSVAARLPSDGGFDQYLVSGLPLSAATTIFFDFLGETRALSAVLRAPGFAYSQLRLPTTDDAAEPGA